MRNIRENSSIIAKKQHFVCIFELFIVPLQAQRFAITNNKYL